MKRECIQAVNQAAGRVLSDAEIRGIDERIDSTMLQLARRDPDAWRALPVGERVTQAAQLAMQDMQAAASRKLANAQRQVIATANTESRITEAMRGDSRSHGLVRDIENTGSYIDGIKRQSMSQLMDLIDAANSSEGATAGRKAAMFLFDAENPQMTKDLVSEIFANGKAGTGNETARLGAEAWLKVTDGMRKRFNAAGGDVGKIEYGYLPQPHDSSRVRTAGVEKWVAETMPKLDRSKYVTQEGRRMSDGELQDFLRAAYDTIATNGLNKTEPGQFKGNGAKANKGSESRQIHFKDGQSYLDYMADYGRGTMYDSMTSHIGGMARDIGLVERYGPNPNAQFQLQNDIAARAEPDGSTLRVFANKPDAYWAIVSGVSGTPDHARLAQVGQDIRNVQTFGKLAGAVLSSVTDMGTMAVTTGFNKLSYWDLFKNVAGQANKETRDFLTTHGIIAESMMGDLNRWAGENIVNGWSGRLANSTMKLSLMNAWTDSMRRGFSMTMMQGLAKLAKKDWADLSEWDRSHMGRKGITEDDWAVIRRGQMTEFNGKEFLTPEAIMASGHENANQVVARVLGFITDESEYAVLNPDLATRAIQTWGGTQTGTVKGESARLVMQFKSFPIAMMSRHWRRMLESQGSIEGAPALANRLAYGAALAVSTTALGAIAFQAKQVTAGKDPVDMTTGKFWARAFTQGGGAGFMGDIILGDTTEDRGQLDTLGRIIGGPTFGSLAEVFELTKGNIDEAMAGKPTHAGAETLRFAKGHTPYLNLWYARAAMDHMLLYGLQENLSPGYQARVKNKAKKDWGQEWWWSPGQTTPERAPDVTAIGGKN